MQQNKTSKKKTQENERTQTTAKHFKSRKPHTINKPRLNGETNTEDELSGRKTQEMANAACDHDRQQRKQAEERKKEKTKQN